MAGIKQSKNNPDNKKKNHGKFKISDECLACQDKCAKGILYIQRFQAKGQGNGIFCDK